MRVGPGHGRVSRCDITWRKTKNSVSDRMEDDSLVHLFTEKKIRRRTKLLNSQLRKIPCNKLSYSEYIKVKTAVLRILSDDELTDDEPVSDNEGKHPADSLESQKRTADALLQEMTLDSSGSDDESRSPRRVNNISGEKRFSGEQRRDSDREESRNTLNSHVTCNSLSVIKRPRGRPRKVKVPISETNCTATSLGSIAVKHLTPKNKTQVASVQSEIVNTDEEISITTHPSNTLITARENAEKEVATSEIDEHNKLEKDPLAAAKINDTDDGISEKTHEDVLHNKDETTNITDEKYNSDDEEFFTPHTSDCEASDDDKDTPLTHVDQFKCTETLLKSDDMFEEKKMIIYPTYDTGNYVDQCKNNVDNTNEQNVSKTEEQSQKSQDTIVEASFVEEEKVDPVTNLNTKVETFNTSESDIFSDSGELQVQDNEKPSGNPTESEEKSETVDGITKEDSFTQEFDAANDQCVTDIEKYIDKTVEKFDEKFNKDSNSLPDQPINSAEKTPAITQSSSKTSADIKRNLLSTLDHLPDESSLCETHHTDNSSTDERISPANPDDQVNSAVTGDSGIDEDSGDILFQDYLKHKEVETDDSSEVSSPLKKTLNLKIKCTEVVKCKYMIVRDNKQRGFSESSSLLQRSSQKALEEIQEEKREDISLRGEESENEKNRMKIVPLRSQLNEYASDESERDQNCLDINRQYLNFTDHSNYRETGVTKTFAPPFTPSQSESLKWVLNSLVRQKCTTNLYQNEQEQEFHADVIHSEEEGEPQEADTSDEVASRPTNIPEFIEGSDMIPLEMPPSLTLADLGDDDDIFLMEIPKSILEQNLKGKRFKLKKGKITIGETRYNVQQTDGEPTSFILRSGDEKKSYRTGIIEPLKHIVVKHQVKDNLIEMPKLEPETDKCVPFPANVKPRNPLILFNHASLTIKDTSPDAIERKIHEKSVKSGKRKIDNQVAPADCPSRQPNTSRELRESKKRRKLYEANESLDMSVTNFDTELNFKEKKRKRRNLVKDHQIKNWTELEYQ